MSDQLMRQGLSEDYGLLPLQNKILEIMVDVDKVCRDNKIDYYVMGGTALGAKRHGGFIPWDDDLDIYMTPHQYKRFLECFNQLPEGKYVIQEHGKVGDLIEVSKVRMNKTTYIEPLYRNRDMHQGIYIDIFMLHNCPNSTLKQRILYFWSKYIVMLGLAHRGYSRQGGLVGFTLGILKILPLNFLRKFAMKRIYKFDNKETDLYCNFLGKARFNQGKYKKEIFGKPTGVDFETVKLFAPEKLDDFLKQRFGDYMKAPLPDRIKWEQHAEVWDVNKDYSEYLKGGHK